MANTPSRRASRVRTKPKKYGDYTLTPTKRSTKKEYDSTDEEMDEMISQPLIKPTGNWIDYA